MQTYIVIILLGYIFSLIFTREFIVVCARAGGANTTSFLAAHFAMRNTKNCGGEKRSGESEGGQKFLPPNPLPFCSPERKSFCSCRAKLGNQNSQSGFSSKKVRISSNKHHLGKKEKGDRLFFSFSSGAGGSWRSHFNTFDSAPRWQRYLFVALPDFAPFNSPRQ